VGRTLPLRPSAPSSLTFRILSYLPCTCALIPLPCAHAYPWLIGNPCWGSTTLTFCLHGWSGRLTTFGTPQDRVHPSFAQLFQTSYLGQTAWAEPAWIGTDNRVRRISHLPRALLCPGDWLESHSDRLHWAMINLELQSGQNPSQSLFFHPCTLPVASMWVSSQSTVPAARLCSASSISSKTPFASSFSVQPAHSPLQSSWCAPQLCAFREH
jgi:hypothetical protein